MKYVSRRLFMLVAINLIGFGVNVFADEKETKRAEAHYNLGKGGLALQGYDPVSYFEEGGGTPQKGKSSITYKIGKTIYRFATTENRDQFKKIQTNMNPSTGAGAHTRWEPTVRK